MFDDFARRVVRPTGLDVALGVVAVLLVLEATRRTLVAGDRRLPLFEAGAAPAYLVLSVRR